MSSVMAQQCGVSPSSQLIRKSPPDLRLCFAAVLAVELVDAVDVLKACANNAERQRRAARYVLLGRRPGFCLAACFARFALISSSAL